MLNFNTNSRLRRPAPAKRPLGQPTRGKTAPNRLRRVDNFVIQYDPTLIRRRDGDYANAFFVDLGYGFDPTTTLESAARLRRLNTDLPVLGVEINSERVAAAQPFADERTHFRLGGFNLPLRKQPDGKPETVRLIRTFNVLRQYDETAVREAHLTLCNHMLPGGLLIEGTSDPFGRLWVANVLRRTSTGEAKSEALVFSTNFRWGFDPGLFQPVLPKNFIHRMVPGEAIFEFFNAWKSAYREAQPYRSLGLRQLFAATAQDLSNRGYAINTRKKWLAKGYLIWRVDKIS